MPRYRDDLPARKESVPLEDGVPAVQRILTDALCRQVRGELEGDLPWWRLARSGMLYRSYYGDGKPYAVINQVLLHLRAAPVRDPRWVTFTQMRANKLGKVGPGSGVLACWWRGQRKMESGETYLLLRYYFLHPVENVVLTPGTELGPLPPYFDTAGDVVEEIRWQLEGTPAALDIPPLQDEMPVNVWAERALTRAVVRAGGLFQNPAAQTQDEWKRDALVCDLAVAYLLAAFRVRGEGKGEGDDPESWLQFLEADKFRFVRCCIAAQQIVQAILQPAEDHQSSSPAGWAGIGGRTGGVIL